MQKPSAQQVVEGPLAGHQISGYNPIFYRYQKALKEGDWDFILFSHVTSFLKTFCPESKTDFCPAVHVYASGLRKHRNPGTIEPLNLLLGRSTIFICYRDKLEIKTRSVMRGNF